MKQVFDRLFGAVTALCKLLMIAQIIIVSYVVFGRFVLNRTPSWGEPLALVCMLWLAMLSAGVAFRDGAHMRVRMLELLFPKRLRPRVQRMLDVFTDLVLLVLSTVLLVAGVRVTRLASGSIISGIGIKSSWLMSAFPAMCVVILLALLEKVLCNWRGGHEHER